MGKLPIFLCLINDYFRNIFVFPENIKLFVFFQRKTCYSFCNLSEIIIILFFFLRNFTILDFNDRTVVLSNLLHISDLKEYV